MSQQTDDEEGDGGGRGGSRGGGAQQRPPADGGALRMSERATLEFFSLPVPRVVGEEGVQLGGGGGLNDTHTHTQNVPRCLAQRPSLT